jgi:hypothetical protein
LVSQEVKFGTQEHAVATTKPIHDLFARLNQLGIATTFARSVLPSWWDMKMADTPSGLQQTQMLLARAFNINLSSLADPKAQLTFLETERKFKLNDRMNPAEVFISAHYATALAKLALRGFKLSQAQVPKDAVELRDAILQSAGIVNLPCLLAWCTQAGIPVLYVHKLPGKKMTGMVVRDADRFAVVLSRKGTPSHLLFHLAHELGHIGHGHLTGNGFVLDEKIGDADRGDADEKEADAYAIRLINGKSVSYSATGAIRSGIALYRAASSLAQTERIDAGHIILNYGNAQKAHGLANQALKHIPGESDGGLLVNAHFWQSFDTDAVSEDQLELLQTALA